jgi:nitrate reductase alpha subunit
MNLGNASEIEPEETVTANTWHTEKKQPWPTLTRRMQFYIDHELYFELGEELPVHKDNPPIGGDYPLQMTSGHTRWSIHAAWRDDLNLLRLQRGVPTVVIGEEDAAARDIDDGDSVQVFNDIGAFEVQAKISPAVRPGQVIVYHAWEPYQFPDHRSQKSITPNPFNPIQLAGGYFHLQPRMAVGTPGPSDRGTRVEVAKLESGDGERGRCCL